MTKTAGPQATELIHGLEDCKLDAYLDTAGVPTIGWGTTRYYGKQPVQLGDTCTRDQADRWFLYDIGWVEEAVDALTVDDIDQRQFDALASFVYNVGKDAYRTSTLRRLVNANPEDPAIRDQFMRWHFDDGKRIYGLWRRRHREADHYFGVTTAEPTWPYGREG